MINLFLAAFHDVFSVAMVSYITLGVAIGYLVGALPGMNRATAIALLIPFTFDLSPLVAISLLIGVNKGGAAGSAVSAILINVPGEPSSVVTTLDGYPMTQQGKSQKALKIALFASVIGDLLSTMVLILLALPLAKLAVGMGPIEISAILIFAITFIAAASGVSFFKGVISGLFGLLLAAIGLDMETGLPRLTFGYLELFDGIPLLAVAIGTLALSEVFVQADRAWRGNYSHKVVQVTAQQESDKHLSMREFRSAVPAIVRGSLAGIFVGILPGLGATLASFLGYTWTKRKAPNKEEFGKGALQGVAASESADNASVPATLVPVFAIGLPGSLATALLMGAFMLHGLTPGPYLFRDDGQLVYGIFLGMIVASLMLLVVGLVGQRFFAKVIGLGDTIILPVIVFLCFFGAYMEGGSMFSVYLMIGFAMLGYVMKKFDYSFVTFVVGYVLGPMTELSVRQAIVISDGQFSVLLDHPVAIIFLALAVFSAWRFGTRRMGDEIAT